MPHMIVDHIQVAGDKGDFCFGVAIGRHGELACFKTAPSASMILVDATDDAPQAGNRLEGAPWPTPEPTSLLKRTWLGACRQSCVLGSRKTAPT